MFRRPCEGCGAEVSARLDRCPECSRWLEEARPPVVTYRELTKVFTGPVQEATLLRSALAARGYETFIPGENTMLIRPFVTSARAMIVDIEAPADQAEAVRREILEIQSGASALDDDEDLPAEFAPEEGQEEPGASAGFPWPLVLLVLVLLACVVAVRLLG